MCKVSEKFFENFSGSLNLSRSKRIARLTQEIDNLQEFYIHAPAMLHEEPDVIGRRDFVPIKLRLHAPQPRLIDFVHTGLFADAGAETSGRSRRGAAPLH